MAPPVVLTASEKAPADGKLRSTANEQRTAQPTEEPHPWKMLEMPATTRQCYVTGIAVLNLRHPSIGMGGSWRRELWGPPGGVALTSGDRVFAKAARITATAMGTAEIADLRPALREAGHRAGMQDEPVWGATHVRATLELAWETLNSIVHGGVATTLCSTYDRRTMRVWLHGKERARAAELGRAMAAAAQDGDLRPWSEWLESLT